MTRSFDIERCGRRSRQIAFGWVAFVAALFAGAEIVHAQTWKEAIAEADAKYDEGMQKLSARLKAANAKAGAAWVKSMEEEIVAVDRSRDTATSRGLAAKVAAAREAGRVPPLLPAGRATFGGHEYALISEGKTWDEARKRCEQMGGHLLLIDSEAEEAFILSNLGSGDFWVGATSLYSPEKYLRFDGTPFRGFKARFRPDDNNKEQKSVAWRAVDKSWDDLEDGLRLPYVCEWE